MSTETTLHTLQKQLPSDWQRVLLGSVSRITNGKTNTQDAVISGEYPLFDRSIAVKRSNKYLFDGTAIILPGEGAEFVPRFYSGKFDLHQRAYAIFPDKQIDAQFLFQYLLAKRDVFAKNAVGSTVKSLRLPIIQAVSIPLPTLNEQTKIAEILSATDKEIQKTSEIIFAAEKLKEGLMQDLFTKGIGHLEHRETELGKVPKGWEVVPLSNVAKVERGKFSHRPRNDPDFYGGKIPFIQTGDVVNSNGIVKEYSQTLNEKGLGVSKMFKKGTVVLTIAANIGDTAILEFDCCFPDSLVGITPFAEMDGVFLEYYLRTRKSYLNEIATQSAQKNINLEKLNPLLIIKPPLEEQLKIAKILSAIDQKILIDTSVRERLEELKKGLMQDLFSGKVRVKGYDLASR